MSRRVMVLGSTGSIGRQALEVIARHPERLRCVGLACRRGGEEFEEQVERFGPESACVAGAEGPGAGGSGTGKSGTGRPGVRRYGATEGLERMIRDTPADVVLNGISGSAGMAPSLAVLELGVDLALANKETVVMAGALARAAALRTGAQILPVDSEHYAVFRLLERLPEAEVAEVILTASGGALRDVPLERLAAARPEDALAHPTWRMGPKITVDSATLANKGLEVIEAHHLFDLAPQRIRVVIHPESLVHALVRTIDGVLYAQVSRPDMRMPIQGALLHPEICSSDLGLLDLPGVSMSFAAVDGRRYPMLERAYEAIRRGGGCSIAYNAANEIAVREFLRGRIGFTRIAEVVAEVLERDWPARPRNVGEVLATHQSACRAAGDAVGRME